MIQRKHHRSLHHHHHTTAITNSTDRKFVESSEYHWICHLLLMQMVPFYHMASWKMCEKLKYSNTSALIGLTLPVVNFVITPILDVSLARLNVYSKEAHEETKEPEAMVKSQLNTPASSSQNRKLIRQKRELESRQYNRVLYCYVISHTIMFLYSMYKVHELGDTALTSAVFWVQILVLGLSQTALGQSVAHELYHRLKTLDRCIAYMLMAQIMYNHFPIEHVYGHHKNVATEKDPATAKFNQTYYSFVFQSTIGGFRSAWRFETERLQCSKNLEKLPWSVFLREHKAFHFAILSFVIVPGSIYLYGGMICLIAFVVQALMAISLVEIINYFEHYGLQREKNPDGSYEPVQDWHSWDKNKGHVSKMSFINIMLHSDHHRNPMKYYHELKCSGSEKTPILPYTYSTMVIASLIPPVFFKIMNNHPIFQNRIQSGA